MDGEQFAIPWGDSPWGIISLKRTGTAGLEFVRPGRAIGEVVVRYRSGGGEWLERLCNAPLSPPKPEVPSLEVVQSFAAGPDRLEWHVACRNHGEAAVEVGDPTSS